MGFENLDSAVREVVAAITKHVSRIIEEKSSGKLQSYGIPSDLERSMRQLVDAILKETARSQK